MYRAKKLTTVLLLPLFAWALLFFQGLSHFPTFTQPAAMSHHSQASSAECFDRCSSLVIRLKQENPLLPFSEKLRPDAAQIEIQVILYLLIAAIAYRGLYFSSSWRPPDKALLFGKYTTAR